MQPEPPRKPRRRWLQFGLRTLFLATTIFGIWLGFHMKRVRRQKEAVQAIREFGGWVHYDFQEISTQPFDFDARAKPPVPEWLLSCLGDDFFFDVVDVNLVYANDSGKREDNRNVRNEALPHLTAFPKLRQLGLKDTQATDDDLRIVGALKTLERFYFWDAKNITDVGVSHLSRLTRLEKIHLSFSQIGDEGLRMLAQLPDMQYIGVQGGRFTDRGLEFLEGKAQLRGLWVGIGETKITDAGVHRLSGLTNLEYLDLQSTGATDAGIEYLKGLTKLERLYLSNTKVTDAGRSHLHGLKTLKKLVLFGTQATGSELKKAVPGCGVIH